MTGAKFKIVHFDGIAEASAAFLGGHVDVDFTAGPSMLSYMESGEVRILGVQDKQESKYWPGVKTFESMGYPFYSTPYKVYVHQPEPQGNCRPFESVGEECH